MKLNFKFGSAVTVIPAVAAEKIISGAATAAETAVLLAIAAAPELETETDAEYFQMISDATGLDTDEVSSAIAFWRGASVISVAGKSKHAVGRVTPVINEAASAATVAENTAEDAVNPAKTDEIEPAKTEESVVETATAPKKKALLRESLPKYDPTTISEICGRDGGMLAAVIDQCQQIFERMFNPAEVSVIVGLNDHLGLEPEYILTLCAYYAKKKPKCKLSYIEKTAYTLWNDGITTVDDLEAHVKNLELYDGAVGCIRRLMGIGGRALTQKENASINHWVQDLGFSTDVIEYCYEVTVNSAGEFSFDYANTVMDGWYSSGVRTLEDAIKASEAHRAENRRKYSNGASTGGITESSFDGDDFLALAIKRSTGGK